MISGLTRSLAAGVRRLAVRTGGDRWLSEATSGAPVGSLLARLVPGNLCYRAPTLRTVVRGGIRFELDVSDYMQWCVYYGIAIEPRAALYGLVRPGQVVFDVGANVGETLLNFARIVGKGGEVWGWEINPATFARCRHNLALNGFGNVRLFNLGFGHETAELRLGRPNDRNSGEDRIVAANGAGQTVSITTMDQFVGEHGVARVDLVKIDVEGFEMNVLGGAEQTLARLRPRLFVELDDGNLRQQGSAAAVLVRWLDERDYDLEHAALGYRVRPTDDFAGRHFDVVCHPR